MKEQPKVEPLCAMWSCSSQHVSLSRNSFTLCPQPENEVFCIKPGRTQRSAVEERRRKQNRRSCLKSLMQRRIIHPPPSFFGTFPRHPLYPPFHMMSFDLKGIHKTVLPSERRNGYLIRKSILLCSMGLNPRQLFR